MKMKTNLNIKKIQEKLFKDVEPPSFWQHITMAIWFFLSLLASFIFVESAQVLNEESNVPLYTSSAEVMLLNAIILFLFAFIFWCGTTKAIPPFNVAWYPLYLLLIVPVNFVALIGFIYLISLCLYFTLVLLFTTYSSSQKKTKKCQNHTTCRN